MRRSGYRTAAARVLELTESAIALPLSLSELELSQVIGLPTLVPTQSSMQSMCAILAFSLSSYTLGTPKIKIVKASFKFNCRGWAPNDGTQ